MAAREQRMAQKKRDAILNAHNTAENIMLHRNIWKQDKEIRDQFNKDNQDWIDKHPNHKPIATDITQTDLKARMTNYDRSLAAWTKTASH
jgi:hypothetical protein